MTVTFGLLLIGFILLDLEHFGFEFLKPIAAVELILCAFAAWYMMAGIIINDLAGKTVLPMGKKLVN
jgi:succinate-acetate transporter protein